MSDHETQVVWTGKHFRVLKIPVTYPDGSVRLHEQVDAPDVVRVYGVLEGAVLLTREYRADIGKRIYRVPAGRIEPGEKPEEAAVREFREEAGYVGDEIELIRTSTPILKFRHQAWHFLVTNPVHVGQDLEYGEEIEIVRVPLSEVKRFVFEGMIPEDSVAISLLTLARRFRT